VLLLLTTVAIVGIIANMKAVKIVDYRIVLPNGILVQAVVWELPAPVPPTTHGFKYRLAAIKDGQRVLGFDNERGKGDHRHDGNTESAHVFVSVEQLLKDFTEAVKELK